MKKRIIAFLVAVICILTSVFLINMPIQASGKKSIKREIAIVFDNSGSMYGGQLSWCRATYGVEVFASMLNEGDVLRVYPMNDITIGNDGYNMNNPLVISGGGDASIIRECYTPEVHGGTPIETIVAAYDDIIKQQADERWLVVLTDGTSFYQNGKELSPPDTKTALESMLSGYINNINIMYLGIGASPVMPSVTGNSQYMYYSAQASNSNEILKNLTAMCNTIFGRDELQITGQTMSFDIDMSKLFIFVQGKDIGNINITDAAGNIAASPDKVYTPRYSEKGNGGYFVVDYDLSGVVAVYSNVPAGEYNLNYSGSVSDIGVYYEPNVDLQIKLTDANGTVLENMTELYPGEYYLQYGLTDSQGNFTESALLGNREFEITYSVNGNEKTEKSDKNGKIAINLEAGDKVDVSAKATYLSGYVIKKDSNDLGWPDGGVNILSWPVEELKLSVSGGKEEYKQSEIEKEGIYKVNVIYGDNKITGDKLKNVKMTADITGGNLQYDIQQKEDAYYVSLKNKGNPYETKAGDYELEIIAEYTDEHQNVTKASATEKFKVTDESHAITLEFEDGNDYFEKSKLDSAKPLKVIAKKDGKPLTDEELAAAKIEVESEGLKFIVEPLLGESAYQIKIDTEKKVKLGVYNVEAKMALKDETGYDRNASAQKKIEIMPYPEWVKWAILALIALIIVVIIIMFMTRKVLPKHIKFVRDTAETTELSGKSTFSYKNKVLEVKGSNGNAYGDNLSCTITMELEPISRRYVKSQKRKVKVSSIKVRGFGFQENGEIEVVWRGTLYTKVEGEEEKLLSGSGNNIGNNNHFEFSAHSENGRLVSFSGKMKYN